MPDYLRLIEEGRPGTRCDVTPVFADAHAFRSLVDDLCREATAYPHDFVAGIDALGFILGSAIATREGKGFISVRKGGKLPVPANRLEFVDYSNQRKSLELRHGAFPAGSRLLLVDEWIETGAQVRAAIELIEQQSGIVAAIACINCDRDEATAGLRSKYPVLQVLPPG